MRFASLLFAFLRFLELAFVKTYLTFDFLFLFNCLRRLSQSIKSLHAKLDALKTFSSLCSNPHLFAYTGQHSHTHDPATGLRRKSCSTEICQLSACILLKKYPTSLVLHSHLTLFVVAHLFQSPYSSSIHAFTPPLIIRSRSSGSIEPLKIPSRIMSSHAMKDSLEVNSKVAPFRVSATKRSCVR